MAVPVTRLTRRRDVIRAQVAYCCFTLICSNPCFPAAVLPTLPCCESVGTAGSCLRHVCVAVYCCDTVGTTTGAVGEEILTVADTHADAIFVDTIAVETTNITSVITVIYNIITASATATILLLLLLLKILLLLL